MTTQILNYKNGQLRTNTYRYVDAVISDLEEIQQAYINQSEETLTTCFKTSFDYDKDLKIATYSGIAYSAEKGFRICEDEEAHNIDSLGSALSVWGLDESEEPIL